jgi:hypothetical protein
MVFAAAAVIGPGRDVAVARFGPRWSTSWLLRRLRGRYNAVDSRVLSFEPLTGPVLAACFSAGREPPVCSLCLVGCCLMDTKVVSASRGGQGTRGPHNRRWG